MESPGAAVGSSPMSDEGSTPITSTVPGTAPGAVLFLSYPRGSALPEFASSVQRHNEIAGSAAQPVELIHPFKGHRTGEPRARRIRVAARSVPEGRKFEAVGADPRALYSPVADLMPHLSQSGPKPRVPVHPLSG